MPKYTIHVSQMVEQIGSFSIEAENAQEALTKAKDGRCLYQACVDGAGWKDGDDADRARIWLVQNPTDNEDRIEVCE